MGEAFGTVNVSGEELLMFLWCYVCSSSLWGLGWYRNSTAYSTSRLICSIRARLNYPPQAGRFLHVQLEMMGVEWPPIEAKSTNKEMPNGGYILMCCNSYLAYCLMLYYIIRGGI